MLPVDGKSEWSGVEVAITGRLVTLSMDLAAERLTALGGRAVASPTELTAFVVVGQGAPPLGEDGRLTAALRSARELQDRGADIEFLSEEEFLDRLGLEERRADLDRLYTTAQLSRILEVPAHRIRAWVRHDLIQPVKVVKRLKYFDFRQAASVRALSLLAKNGVRPARIRKSLEQLSAWLPEAQRSLAQLETLEQSKLLVVRTEEGRLAEPSGQLRLEFQIQEDPPAPLPSVVNREAEACFQRGIQAEEEGNIEEATQAYEAAISLGKQQPEVYFNLGNALYTLDEKPSAAERFLQAAELDPEYVEAWNNLGNALADLGKTDEALRSYRQAIELQSDYADAHYNLAETLADLGEYAEAREHWRAYLERDPSSSWSQVVRERLRRTGGEE